MAGTSRAVLSAAIPLPGPVFVLHPSAIPMGPGHMEATMLVKEAMTGEVRWYSPDTPIQEVARVMRDEGIGCVPIGDNDRLVGMITDRDITCRGVAAGERLEALTCRAVMSPGIFFCFEDQTLEQALGQMQERQVHHLPVLNRQKRMTGLISLGDIALKGESSILAPLAKIAARDAERHLKAA
jgi:CBS domain-containing protein